MRLDRLDGSITECCQLICFARVIALILTISLIRAFQREVFIRSHSYSFHLIRILKSYVQLSLSISLFSVLSLSLSLSPSLSLSHSRSRNLPPYLSFPPSLPFSLALALSLPLFLSSPLLSLPPSLPPSLPRSLPPSLPPSPSPPPLPPPSPPLTRRLSLPHTSASPTRQASARGCVIHHTARVSLPLSPGH